MSFVKLSSKGQITLPSRIRNFLGITPHEKLEILVRDNYVVIQPLKPFRKLRGSVKSKKGNSRKVVGKAAASHVSEK